MRNFLLLILVLIATLTTSAQNTKVVDTTAVNGLPVLRSYVPPDVVHRAIKKYGHKLYCIEQTKSAGCQNAFLVGIIRNGRLSIEWMCDDPKMVMQQNKTSLSDTAAG